MWAVKVEWKALGMMVTGNVVVVVVVVVVCSMWRLLPG
jgi:hypothetical protein